MRLGVIASVFYDNYILFFVKTLHKIYELRNVLILHNKLLQKSLHILLSNLEWVTSSENCQRKTPKEKFYNSKGCYDDRGNYFNSYREAGKFYNISPNTVKRDCLGLTTRIEKYEGRECRPTFHK